MTRRLPWLVAALAIDEAYADESHAVPTLTELIHSTPLLFRPRCKACGVKQLSSRTPKYRGFLR